MGFRKVIFTIAPAMILVSSMAGPVGCETTHGAGAEESSIFGKMGDKASVVDSPLALRLSSPPVSVGVGLKPTPTENDPHISPKKAFLLSALLPGAGQLYSGNKRGLLFLSVEAVTWTGYIVWTIKGNDLEDEYQRFAGEHWKYDEYIEYILAAVEGTADTAKLTHDYDKASKQQQYEMIGKYDQFVYGWDDTDASKDGYPPVDSLKNVRSGNRSKYMDKRYESNKYLKRAGYCVGVILVNHLVSAIDAARCAKTPNPEKGLKLKILMKNDIPMLTFSKRF